MAVASQTPREEKPTHPAAGVQRLKARLPFKYNC